MRRLQRLPLSPATLAFLDKRTASVAEASDSKAEAERLWSRQDNKAFHEVRSVLHEMASGIERCMYCEDSQGTAIDHFWPKAVYPDRAYSWANYLLACTLCNSNFKREQFPLDHMGQPLLLDPTAEDPLEHLAFSPSTGKYSGISPKGECSIQVFGLFRASLEKGRKSAWDVLEILLPVYSEKRQAGDSAKAQDIEQAVRHYPFSGVLAALVRIVQGPDAVVVSLACRSAIQQYPEILTWV